MSLTKPCEVCGAVFEKPASIGLSAWARRRFCSMGCKVDSQRGKAPWNKGQKRPSTKPKQMLPCRICGQPTTYHGTRRCHLYGMVHCGNPACAEESKRIKNDRISARHTNDYATGKREKVRHTWKGVQRVSPEEIALTPWLTDLGWEPQYHVNTGVHTNTLPRQFILDFALPDQKLYVEIDGSIHRLRKERDARRDAMLFERGWRGLRISARRVRESPDDVTFDIALWTDIHTRAAATDNLT